jgi:hypothetical protein
MSLGTRCFRSAGRAFPTFVAVIGANVGRDSRLAAARPAIGSVAAKTPQNRRTVATFRC